jgi:hypothetical protein
LVYIWLGRKIKENKSLDPYTNMKQEWWREIYTYTHNLNEKTGLAWLQPEMQKPTGIMRGV